MQLMITSKYEMANRDDVVKRAGRCKENHDKRERVNNHTVMSLHYRIDGVHGFAPGWNFTPPWRQRN
jgi:hypothetical protein